jgi:hypothetical protein
MSVAIFSVKGKTLIEKHFFFYSSDGEEEEEV